MTSLARRRPGGAGSRSPTTELVLVGEAPGDHEDQEGRPFVGPAGKLLDKALAQAGLDRPTPVPEYPQPPASMPAGLSDRDAGEHRGEAHGLPGFGVPDGQVIANPTALTTWRQP
jgi:hypothetical protein